MNPLSVAIEPRMMRTGLKRVMLRSRDTVLCVLGSASFRLIGVSDLRMMVSWEHLLAGPPSPQFYVLPPLVTHFLVSPLSQEFTGLGLSTVGKHAVLAMTDDRGQYELRWRADLRQFMAPPEFAHMLTKPTGLISISYLSLSDAAHQAVANLVNMESMQDIPKEKLAILIDFSTSRFTLDGRPIVHGASGRFYFDPRLIIRALEIVKSNTLQVGMTPLPVGHRAVLMMLGELDGWRVQCSLLSIGADTQKLYPLPPEQIASMQE